jgi:photosystem II stability/assembly factor-like uncharacterized protein
MTDLRLETKIREAFDSRHEPSPDLEDRVIAAMPWQRVKARPARSSPAPRLAGAFAVVLAVALIVVLAAPTILNRLGALFPGLIGNGEPPAYSLAAVTGDYVFIVQRSIVQQSNGNVLLESSDNGRTWQAVLRFPGVYGGTQIFGNDGFVWSIDMAARNCTSANPCSPPSQALTLYRTTDGGVSWNALPPTTFPVEDVFFVDASHGWADSASPVQRSEALYATVDGGVTWSLVGPLPTASPMGYVYGVGNYRVTFSRSSNGSLRGWYVGATQLFTSTDEGRSWHPVAFEVPATAAGWIVTPQQPEIEDPAGVVAIAYRDPKGPDNATSNRIYLYSSRDGGATWGNPRPAPEGFAPVGDILSTAILDPQHVWLTSQSQTGGDNVQAGPAVARTSNGGISWQVASKTPRILSMTFLDPIRGYALDVSGPTNVNGILKTIDSGATWQRIEVPIFQAK